MMTLIFFFIYQVYIRRNKEPELKPYKLIGIVLGILIKEIRVRFNLDPFLLFKINSGYYYLNIFYNNFNHYARYGVLGLNSIY